MNRCIYLGLIVLLVVSLGACAPASAITCKTTVTYAGPVTITTVTCTDGRTTTSTKVAPATKVATVTPGVTATPDCPDEARWKNLADEVRKQEGLGTVKVNRETGWVEAVDNVEINEPSPSFSIAIWSALQKLKTKIENEGNGTTENPEKFQFRSECKHLLGEMPH